MALPRLASSKYELTLPSTGQKVEYRPFLVKEEKALMIAQQTGKESDMIRAVQNIVSACTFEAVNSKSMPLFDLEYVFLQLRSKSVGEVAKLKVKCPDDGETEVEVDVPLEDITCVKEVGHDTKIPLTDSIGIIMNYPTVDMMLNLDLKDETATTFEIIKSCVHQIYDADNVYVRNDMEEKDLDEFIDSMSHDQFEKLSEFFDTMPKVKYPVKVKNPKTGVESEVVLQGLSDFF
jgi:hypothetical protein|tara:strand:- start:3794 stop:4495 length:702 start_codon:yes stop_codon:yes gene_type:complete